jgi:hypothetical protein
MLKEHVLQRYKIYYHHDHHDQHHHLCYFIHIGRYEPVREGNRAVSFQPDLES